MVEKFGVFVDLVGRKYWELNIGQLFDKYVILNGFIIYILSRFLDSRNLKIVKVVKKLLDEYLENGELKIVFNK